MPFRYPPTKTDRPQYVALSTLEVVLVIAIIGGLLGLGWASLHMWGRHSVLRGARAELISYLRLASERAELTELGDRYVSVALQTKLNEAVHVRMFEEDPQSHAWHLLDGGWAMPARIHVEGTLNEISYKEVQVVTSHGESKTLGGTWLIIEFDNTGALRNGQPYTIILRDDMNREQIDINASGKIVGS